VVSTCAKMSTDAGPTWLSKFGASLSGNAQFLDRWSAIWILLAFVLLFVVVNQLYLSIGSETHKRRQAFKWTQLAFLLCIPVLSGFLIHHQASLHHPKQFLQSAGIFQNAIPAFVLVLLLTITALSLQLYIMAGESTYHRRRLLDVVLFMVVFLTAAATMMAVQPVY